jgi:predicted RNase H-like HicB family nuclease
MSRVYPVIVKETKDVHTYLVYIPAFDTYTEGDTLDNAIYMARDAIGSLGLSYEDCGKKIPVSDCITPPHTENEIVTLVDIDFDEYRKANDMRTVRRNVSLPGWLNYKGEAAGVNFSAVLQKALMRELHL